MWETIEETTAWPDWWRGVVRVKTLHPGDADKVGSRYEIEWRSRLPYPLAFEFTTEKVERPLTMEGRAEGELAGTGRWRLFEDAGVTALLYEWNVRTTKPWMNLFGPVARPVFAWNHDVVMGWGGEGLARRVGGRLIAKD